VKDPYGVIATIAVGDTYTFTVEHDNTTFNTSSAVLTDPQVVQCDGLLYDGDTTGGKTGWLEYDDDGTPGYKSINTARLTELGISMSGNTATLSKCLYNSNEGAVISSSSPIKISLSDDITLFNKSVVGGTLEISTKGATDTVEIEGNNHSLTLKSFSYALEIYKTSGSLTVNFKNVKLNAQQLYGDQITATITADNINIINSELQFTNKSLDTSQYALQMEGAINSSPTSADYEAKGKANLTDTALSNITRDENEIFRVGSNYAKYVVLTSPVPLTFTAEQANSTVTFNWTSATSVSYKTSAMSDWATYTINTPITLTNVGDSVSFKGKDVKTNTTNHFSMTGKIAASGDVTSLTNEVGGNTALAELSCASMFMNCTSLTTVPNLPSTSLAKSCYSGMFSGCTGLTSVPSDLLPSMALAEGCYSTMFYNCTNLTNIPDLPATTLAKSCYTYMFEGCSKIKVIQSDTKAGNYVIPFKLPNDTAATTPVTEMFKDTGGTFKGTPLLNTQYYIETTSKPTECTGNACSISASKGANSIVAHINTTIEPKDVVSLTSKGEKLGNGVDYTLFKGSLGVVINKTFIDALGVGSHEVDVNYDLSGTKGTYTLYITITGDSPSPSKKDESCEKVIGPTWHWNNDKGICEDVGVVGTATR